MFLIVRHAPGGAGRFLMSCLMASASVSHFDPAVEADKTDTKCLDYIKRKYTPNLYDWLKNEPNPAEAWNLHFISAMYPRGDDLTIDQFAEQAQESATEHFWNSIDKNKLIGLCWHKNSVPQFTQDSRNILIQVDPESVKWLHRANWYKHHTVENDRIHLLTHDPNYNPAMLRYYSKFNNPVYVDQHPIGFIKNNIINCAVKKKFQDPENFAAVPNLAIIKLSAILDQHSFVDQMMALVDQLRLEPISESFLTQAQQYYLTCNPFKYTHG